MRAQKTARTSGRLRGYFARGGHSEPTRRLLRGNAHSALATPHKSRYRRRGSASCSSDPPHVGMAIADFERVRPVCYQIDGPRNGDGEFALGSELFRHRASGVGLRCGVDYAADSSGVSGNC